MNTFDLYVIRLFNRPAGQLELFDNAVYFLSGNSLLKGGAIVALLWWLWFRSERYRPALLATLTGTVAAITTGRLMALLTPFRNRPLHEDALGFVLPLGMKADLLDGWSSFPSDHAVMFFALATGLFHACRSIGVLAFCHALVIIVLPRIYLGLHYPTDCISGAMIGIFIGGVSQALMQKTGLTARMLEFSQRAPSWFYASLFLVSFQICTMFTEVRSLAKAAALVIGL